MPRGERPLHADGSPLVEFALDLRELRKQAGKPAYRALSAKAHFAASTLAEAAGGQKLPSLAVTLAFVRVCGGNEAEWEHRWHALAAKLEPPAAESLPPEGTVVPYPGLAAFTEADTERFHGRDRLLEQLQRHLQNGRFVAVFGASGAGKTSLLRAGLLPRLALASVVAMTPGAQPLEECALALASLLGKAPGQVLAALRADERGLHQLTRQIAEAAGQDVLVVVDQFEELFTVCSDESERAAFLAALTIAATSERSAVRIVLGVRADFYPHCASRTELAELLQEAMVTVGAMSTEQTRQAILGPARAADCVVENALLTHLVTATANQTGVLPLLSHALRETWVRRNGHRLTLAGYQATGGLDGAVARSAEAVYSRLTEPQQHRARHLFRRLTALGEGTADTKRRICFDELDGDASARVVVQAFTEARLLVLDHGTLDLTHETLLTSWPRLRGWLAEDRDGMRTQQRLAEATAQWRALGFELDALYRGTRLTEALEWAAREPSSPTPSEHAFLRASATSARMAEFRQQRPTRRLRALALGLAALLIGSIALAGWALVQAGQARQSQQEAESRQLAAEARLMLRSDPAQAARLAVRAYRTSPTEEAGNLLLNLEQANPQTRSNAAQAEDVPPVALSPDGRFQARLHEGGVIVYTLPEQNVAAELSHTDGTLRQLTLNHTGEYVAGLSEHGKLLLWEVRTRRMIAPETSAVTAFFFRREGPQSESLVTFEQGAMTEWDLRSHRRTGQWQVDRRAVVLAAGNADNELMATINQENTMEVWDLHKRKRLAVLSGVHPDPVALSWTADNRVQVHSTTSTQQWIVNPRLAATRICAALNQNTEVAAEECAG